MFIPSAQALRRSPGVRVLVATLVIDVVASVAIVAWNAVERRGELVDLATRALGRLRA